MEHTVAEHKVRVGIEEWVTGNMSPEPNAPHPLAAANASLE